MAILPLKSTRALQSSAELGRAQQELQGDNKDLQRIGTVMRVLGIVFESPVWSGFLMPKGFNRNHNRSAFFPEVKRLNRTAKRLQSVVFAVFRPVSVFIGFNGL